MTRSIACLLGAAVLTALTAGCASTPDQSQSVTAVNADCVEGAVTRSDLPNLSCGRRQKPIALADQR